MILGLVKQHPLFRTLPKLLAFALLTATLVTNLLTFMVVQKQTEAQFTFTLQLVIFPATLQLPEYVEPTYTLFWVQLAMMLAAAAGLLLRGGNIRTSPWNLGLPFTSDQLWRSHYISLMIGFLLLLLFQYAVVVALLQLLTVLMERAIVPPEKLALALVSPVLVLIFLAGMVAGYRNDLADLADSAGWKRYRLILLAVAVLIMAGLSYLSPWYGVIPAAIGVAYACRARGSLPAGLSLGNGSGTGTLNAEKGDWKSLAVAPVIYKPASPFLSLSLLNQLFKIPYPYVAVLMLLPGFFGAMMGGFSPYESGRFGEFLRMGYLFLTIYLLFAFSGEFVLRLSKVDGLPVDRRILLRYLVLPGLAALLICYGGARLWMDYKDYPQEQIQFQDAYGKFGAAAGPGFNTITRKGNSITVTAPWGESHEAVARHPIPAYPSFFASNSEYLTEGPTSRKFLAWQFSRAVEKVYGVWIEPDEIDERYIQEDEEGKFFVPRKGFTVSRDYGLKPSPGGPVAPFLLTPTLVGWFLVMGFYFNLLQESRTIKWARVTWWIFMGLLFVLHILQTLGKLPFWSNWSGAVLIFSTARGLGEMGAVGHLLAYGVGLALTLLAWRFCVRAFLNLEAPRV